MFEFGFAATMRVMSNLWWARMVALWMAAAGVLLKMNGVRFGGMGSCWIICLMVSMRCDGMTIVINFFVLFMFWNKEWMRSLVTCSMLSVLS